MSLSTAQITAQLDRLLASDARASAVAIRAAFDPPGLTLLQANGALGGQTVGHFHLHVVPRYEGDGVSFTWPRQEPGPDVLNAYAERLRQAWGPAQG